MIPLHRSIVALLFSGALCTTLPADSPAAPQAATGEITFAPVVARLLPSVVTILNLGPISSDESAELAALPTSFRARLQEKGEIIRHGEKWLRKIGMGSGALLDGEGHIVTNHHVVDSVYDRDEQAWIGGKDFAIFVGLEKTPRFGRLVGTDPSTDIAVLKIDTPTPAPLTWGDSTKSQVGDLVLAIGTPLDFSIRLTVTMGIISGMHRTEGGLRYTDYIQTDAAINHGNSGGPLFNTRGEVIGFNQSILHADVVDQRDGRTATLPGGVRLQSEGNSGIGFAVPTHIARKVVDDLIKDGRVNRGYLGLKLRDAWHYAGEQATPVSTTVRGVVVETVLPDSPAAKAGISEKDIIVEFAGNPVSEAAALRLAVAMTAPGLKVHVCLLREGGVKELDVTIADLASSPHSSIGFESDDRQTEKTSLKGVELEEVRIRTRGDPRDRGGLFEGMVVAVADVDAGSPAANAGLRRGQILAEVMGVPVDSVAKFNAALASAKGDSVLLRVLDRAGSRELVVPLK